MKRIISFLLALLLLAAMAIPAAAATQEGNMIKLEEARSIVIGVQWDKEQPDVVFLAPDGTEYSPLVEREGTSAILSENALYYIIENAAAGQWRVRYNKKGNTTLDISVHNYQQPLVIQSFTMTPPEENRSTVKFTVNGPEGKRFYYRISVMIDHTGTEKELANGSASTGRETERIVSFSKQASYDSYLLKLTVWYNDSGVDVMDFAYSEPFAYHNDAQDKDLPDYQVTMLPREHLLQVHWPDLPWQVDSLLVAVFEDGAQEPLFFQEYTPNDKFMEFGYSPEAATVSVEVSFRRSGIYSTPVRRDIQPADFLLDPPEVEAVNSLQLALPYHGMTGQTVTAVVNGYASELTPQGDGSFQLSLKDDWNALEASYSDGKGITWIWRKDILVDRKPPVLSMTRDYDGMHLEGQELTVSGSAADCAVLTLNGEELPLTEDGGFAKTLTLSEGPNDIIIVAADALGNESLYTATVISGSGNLPQSQTGDAPEGPGSLLVALTAEGNYYVVAAVSVLCLLVIGYALIFWKKGGRK